MGKSVKIIGICGSPLKNGNTAKVIRKVLEGCEAKGAKTEFISFVGKKLSFCISCYECIKKGYCIINDDLIWIRNKMIESHGIVIGSPTYNREVTGQMKTFFDRLFYDIHQETFLGKYAICINTYLFTPGCSMKTLRDLTMALGFNVVNTINVKLWEFKNEVENNKELLDRAFKTGITLVENINKRKRFLKQDFIRKYFIRPTFRKIDKLIEEIFSSQ